MIRINLARNRASDPGTQIQGDGAGLPDAASGGGVGSAGREVVLKLLVIFIFVGGLMVYESQNLKALSEQRNQLAREVSRLQSEANKKAAEAEKYKNVESQARELEDKLRVLKLLSHLRLRTVKTLDFMQNMIPDRVWLKSVSYESDRANLEAGQFQVSGGAVTTEDLSDFVKKLDDSFYVHDVVVIKNQEVATQKTGSIRDFMFSAEAEGKH